MSTVKEEAIKTIESLDDNTTWEDVVYTLYVRKEVADGLGEIENGEFVSHEDIKREFLDEDYLDKER
ncbi:MAG: hypothetical protein OEV78_07430 [Spirochaetia bacterium]|nr:hypothetical protein [Spirochaetia bacterium]